MKLCYLAIPAAVVLASCAQQSEVQQGPIYQASPSVALNEAEVFSEVLPMHGEQAVNLPQLIYQASTSNFQGPLRWRFVAVGTEGIHQSMQVQEVQIETSKSKRKVKLRAGSLGGPQAFQLEEMPKSKNEPQKQADGETEPEEPQARWMASYEIPTVLQLFPAADGRIVVAAKVVIATHDYTETEWVNFAILPQKNTTKVLRFRRTMIEVDGVPLH